VERTIYFITFPVGQKFTYTQLVFGSIAFKLFNLGQTFWVAFHKLPTISWVNFGHMYIPQTRSHGLQATFALGWMWQGLQTITDQGKLSRELPSDTSLPDELNHFYARVEASTLMHA
jgi:hypothetical protein